MPIRKSKIAPVETIAEKSGITSIADKEKEIQKVVQQSDPIKKEKKKRILTDEQKQVLRARLEKARAIKKEKQQLNKKIKKIED